MPELPEVETIRRSLLPAVGRTVAAVQVIQPLLRWPLAADFACRLRGRAIRDIGRAGKYLLFQLSGAEILLVHLGMSGSLLLASAPRSVREHDHVIFDLGDGITLVYHDPRRFGSMQIGAAGEFRALQHLGCDPLGAEFSADRLWALTRRRKRPIKTLLMDQAVVSGLGNIYANEILFHAHVRPGRSAGRLARREVRSLVEATRTVLGGALRAGGSSISDYRDGNGRPGYFQLRLNVYGRAGQPCLVCGACIRRVVHAGRSSFYCRTCQH